MTENKSKAVTARGFHPFPFRTGQLSPAAPMVLLTRESRSPPPYKASEEQSPEAFLCQHFSDGYFSVTIRNEPGFRWRFC